MTHRGALATILCAWMLLPESALGQYLSKLHGKAEPIRSMAKGPDGFLWLAAADGVFRFDGLHFQRMTEFPDQQAFEIVFTRDGTMWVRGTRGVWRHRDGFHLALEGDVADIESQGNILWAAKRPHLVGLSVDTGVEYSIEWNSTGQLSRSPDGVIWFVCAAGGNERRLCAIRDGKIETFEKPSIPPDTDRAAYDAAGNLVLGHRRGSGEKITIWRDGRKIDEDDKTGRSLRPLITADGRFRVLGGGLVNAVDGRIVAGLFEVSTALSDGPDRVWVASLSRGLQEVRPEAPWRVWASTEFPSVPKSVNKTIKGTTVVAAQHHILELNPQGRWRPLTGSAGREYFGMLPLVNGEWLAAVRDLGVARFSAQYAHLESAADPTRQPNAHRKIVPDSEGRIWVAGKTALMRLEGAPGTYRLEREPLPGAGSTGLRVFDNVTDIEFDGAGRIWVGYDRGIAWRDQSGLWHSVKTSKPVAGVRSITLSPGREPSEIWVSYRPAGAFSRLRKQGATWIVEDFAASAGYTPPDTHFIKRDSRGWLWRGSPQGVFVSDGKNTGPHDWLHIHRDNGLADNDTDMYGFFEDRDGGVWIAGGGVTHLMPDQSWFNAPASGLPPRLTLIEMNGTRSLVTGDPPTQFGPATHLTFEIGSMQTSPLRAHVFRYRLLPLFEEWRPSASGRLEFAGLREGTYILEAAHAGGGSAPLMRHEFQLGPPGLLARSWHWLVTAAGCLGVLLWILRRSPPADYVTYHAAKAWFRLRQRQHPSGGSHVDHSGSIMAGKYSILRPVSNGGFSTVYEALDLRDNSRLAVKIVHLMDASEGWGRDRFAQEVAALHAIDHPGVVSILDSWVSAAGEPCLAMPFLEGPTLRSELNKGPIDPIRTARIVSGLGEALSAVHARGIVHRDLKPENVMVAHETGIPTIIDFGTAGFRGPENVLARTTLLSGSFHYMAPERLTGHYSPAADLFSLAVIAFEMLTGKRTGDLGICLTEDSLVHSIELELITVPEGQRASVARLLADAYNPVPARRPADSADWAGQLSELLRATESKGRSREAIH